MRLILWCVLMAWATAANAAPGALRMQDSELKALARSPLGTKMDLAAFPAGPGVLTRMQFERIDVYADGARIVEVGANGERELPRSTRIHLLGYSADGGTRVGISFDPDLAKAPEGAGSGPAGAFVVRSERTGKSWRFSAISAESALPPGVKLEYPANEDSLPNPYAPPELLSHLTGNETLASTPARVAVVAIDTDTTFMNLRFGGNPMQATAWIADLFAQVNLIYRRDLNVVLQQGTTFLRTASDPYPNADGVATGAMLDEFGLYWQNNYSTGGNNVSRSFAALLSGNSSQPNQASGIAWVNSYCRTASFGGSYSTNQIFTNPGVGVASTAFIVAHEIGHNFGAAHTHCSNASTGAYPTGSGTIDQCFNGESDCYAGPPTCPTSGPGAPKGTLMSYCHTSGANSANCTSNVQQFHPTHVTQLLARIAANTPSCLRSELIFANGFQ